LPIIDFRDEPRRLVSGSMQGEISVHVATDGPGPTWRESHRWDTAGAWFTFCKKKKKKKKKKNIQALAPLPRARLTV
jgi:hypothetical protein